MVSGSIPTCPRHPGSRVWRDGTYETARGRRPRYRCLPDGSDPPHRFVEADAAPWGYSFTADEIAAALVEVGLGTSYREAARRARAQAGASASADGNTVAGWVDLLAPAIFARYAIDAWPDVVALDSLTFRARTPLRVLAALEPLRRGRSRFVALEAFRGGARAAWARFLRSRSGVPREVVCAPDPDVFDALDAVWLAGATDSPSVLVSHLHLARQLLERLRDEGVGTGERFYQAAAHALESSDAWRSFLALPAPRRLRGLEDWLDEHAVRITRQLELAGAPATTNAALLAKKLDVVRERLEPRRANLRNRDRTNRLLMLAQLDLDGRADQKAYARTIADALRLKDAAGSA